VRTVLERSDAVARVAEVFRELGYEGASLSQITERTGLGKGSLYHFFPGGKEEMAAAVLAHVDAWFAENLFLPLEQCEPREGISRMWRAAEDYFRSGKRICLVGSFALDLTRDKFVERIRNYFARWIAALDGALIRHGVPRESARSLSEHVVLGIQGALVLSRALDENSVFARAMARLMADIEEALKT
jgi:TetR/AcrR family transcriptional repressor of lmrAB and yxaGH operons